MPVTATLCEKWATPPRRILMIRSLPGQNSSRYELLAKRYNLVIESQAVLRVEPISIANFRVFKPKIVQATALIFTNKIVIDTFFFLIGQCHIKLSADLRFFCATEPIANYLQRYVITRKRKIFFGTTHTKEFFRLLKKHKQEKFFLPCSEKKRPDITAFFKEQGQCMRGNVIYHTKIENLTGIDWSHYDLITFFSPREVKVFAASISSLQRDTLRVALFGEDTLKEVNTLGWNVAVKAPSKQHASLVDALDTYFAQKE